MIHTLLKKNNTPDVGDISRDPGKYYKLIDIVKGIDENQIASVGEIMMDIAKEKEAILMITKKMNHLLKKRRHSI